MSSSRRGPMTWHEVDETGATLEDNARLKAAALCAAVQLPAIADDTGLEVDALDGGRASLGAVRGRRGYLRRQCRQAPARARGPAGRTPDRAVLDGRDRPVARRPRGRCARHGRRCDHRGAPRARRASDTTRSSCRSRATAVPSPRWPRRRSTRSRTAARVAAPSRAACKQCSKRSVRDAVAPRGQAHHRHHHRR